jgi:hypothetical protein
LAEQAKEIGAEVLVLLFLLLLDAKEFSLQVFL